MESMSMEESSDEDIVRLVHGGDKEAFGVLVERYEAKLERYGRKFLANQDDLKDRLQEVFLKAYMNIREFDASRRFSPWIYRIAHNEFVNTLKRQRPILVSFFDFDVLFPHIVAESTLEEEWDARLLHLAMEQCLAKLDSKYREVVVLHYYEDIDYRQIADILEIPVSTVGVRLLRARVLLKKYYQESQPNI
jgi:RNA polymerase sigma-70 factor (ECF subfamily)